MQGGRQPQCASRYAIDMGAGGIHTVCKRCVCVCGSFGGLGNASLFGSPSPAVS